MGIFRKMGRELTDKERAEVDGSSAPTLIDRLRAARDSAVSEAELEFEAWKVAGIKELEAALVEAAAETDARRSILFVCSILDRIGMVDGRYSECREFLLGHLEREGVRVDRQKLDRGRELYKINLGEL